MADVFKVKFDYQLEGFGGCPASDVLNVLAHDAEEAIAIVKLNRLGATEQLGESDGGGEAEIVRVMIREVTYVASVDLPYEVDEDEDDADDDA